MAPAGKAADLGLGTCESIMVPFTGPNQLPISGLKQDVGWVQAQPLASNMKADFNYLGGFLSGLWVVNF